MINITNNRARVLYQAEFERQMNVLENTFFKEIRPLLGRQFFNAANLIQNGVALEGVNHAVDLGRRRLIVIMFNHYKRVAVVFSRKAYAIIERAQKRMEMPSEIQSDFPLELKTPKEEFWTAINKWARVEAAQKIRKVQDTTKKVIAGVIHKGMQDGESHVEIAKRLRKTSQAINPYRAKTIALTETHGAAVKSVDAAIASTRIEMEREWVSARDKRTRRRGGGGAFEHYATYPNGPNGERVSQDGEFIGTGQAMRYPGDSRGSAGNVVRCRCVLLYHSVKVTDKLKPHEPLSVEDELYGEVIGKGGPGVGKPLNFYIGSAEKSIGVEIEAGKTEFWFTSNKQVAKNYGPNIHKAQLRMKNPKILRKVIHDDELEDVVKAARLSKHDGLIAQRVRDNNIEHVTAVVFDPKQIKLPAVKWKPTMTEKEAAIWNADSTFKANAYHGTTIDAANAIKKEGFKYAKIGNRTDAGILGKAFYFADDVTVANSYAVYSDSLVIKINVKNPLSDEKIFSDLRKAVKEKVKIKLGKTPTLSEFSKELANEVQRRGYDAIIYGDGAQIAVFNPKNIVVITK